MMPFIFPVINEITRKIVRKKFVHSIVLSDGVEVDCLKFGKGPALLIILGLGDGVRTVKDISLILMFTFLSFARKNQVVIISRRRKLREHTPLDQIANDFLFAINQLGLEEVFIWGHSAGGLIAQCISRLEPEKVKGLILSKTFCRPNQEFSERVQIYLEELKGKSLASFIVDISPLRLKSKTLKRIDKILFFIVGKLMRRNGEERVYQIISSLLSFDSYQGNRSLSCPVLIFTDQNDTIVPNVMQEDLVTSYITPKVVTTRERGEGHLITFKSFFLYQREITRFIGEALKDQTRSTIQVQTTKINNM